MSLPPPIWRAFSGTSSSSSSSALPSVGSSIYYFPQGHSEHSSSLPHLPPSSPSFSLCYVTSLRLLAHPLSDEVFASIRLRPIPSNQHHQHEDHGDLGDDGDDDDVVSFSKILTPSDANNGGGFSVPRFCADSIFPELDFRADPPVQTISVRDVHGNPWEFRHIYRGTPRRHLLTTGWSRFVNSKKLVAGDSVVFIRNRARELFVGIRRTGRYCAGNVEGLKSEGSGFSRNVKGRVPAESVEEAVRLMGMGCEFEVVYYPRAGWPEFVVEKERVERAVSVDWREGMRVTMSVETEDSSRMMWFQGTIAGKEVPHSGPWMHSPWRMLQVNWDEPEVLQNVRAVSPWQVELVSPQMQAPFPAMKKLRFPHRIELPTEGQGNILCPQSVIDSTKMGNLTSFFNYHNFPAGMQGARHDFGVPSYYSFVPRNTHHILSHNFYGTNMPQELNTSQSEATSLPSQESIHNSSMEHLGGAAYNPPTKANKGSFQLFGQIIYMDKPDNDIADKDYAEKDGVLSLEYSPILTRKRLLDGLGVQHQRIQAVEACTL